MDGMVKMKYAKTFYAVCITTFLVTFAALAIIVLAICKVLALSTGLLLIVAFSFLVLLFLSFCCGCILQTLYDDWKWRSIGKHEKWRREV